MNTLEPALRAAERIRPHIRRTPLLDASIARVPGNPSGPLHLKLENLQVTGSFKARGAVNRVLSLDRDQRARGIITASGGNHGLGVAYAGWITKCAATVVLPENAPRAKQEKLESWGARVIRAGAVWDDANVVALQMASASDLAYVHPFADEDIISGQATIALEILGDRPDVDVVIAAIGGGGLIGGVSLGAKLSRPGIRVIGVEPTGAPTLYESRKAGQVVSLTEIRTAANTLAPRRSHERNFAMIERYVDDIVLVTDDEMRSAAKWLWFEFGVASELSGAAAVAALMTGRIRVAPGAVVCAIVCGAGTDGIV